MRDFAIGVYPLLADDTVCFAAIDFDKASWRSDSHSVCETLKSLGLPIARERSRSGNGAHLWFFFEAPQPARFVRDVLTYALTITMERNPEVGLSSYDRIFPNQDGLWPGPASCRCEEDGIVFRLPPCRARPTDAFRAVHGRS